MPEHHAVQTAKSCWRACTHGAARANSPKSTVDVRISANGVFAAVESASFISRRRDAELNNWRSLRVRTRVGLVAVRRKRERLGARQQMALGAFDADLATACEGNLADLPAHGTHVRVRCAPRGSERGNTRSQLIAN